MITFEVKQQIKKLAHQTENEVCGLIINKTVIPCVNLSNNPAHHFSISPLDYLKNTHKGKIQFIYHSHAQSPEFSEFDKINLYNLKLRGLMYCKEKDLFKYFLPESYDNQYVGRSFEIGKMDCLTLITDYYKNELGVILPVIDRQEGWYKKNPNTVNENIPAFLNKIPLENALKNDIVVFDILNNGCPNHFGIYLENDLILHHPRHKNSTIEILSKEKKERIPYCLRYNN